MGVFLQIHGFTFAAQVTALMSLLGVLWRVNKRHIKGHRDL